MEEILFKEKHGHLPQDAMPFHKRMSEYEYYPSYTEQEEQKSKGWELLSKRGKSMTDYERSYVILHTIIWSHYWRARISIEMQRKRKTYLKKIRGSKYYSCYVLDIDHYTKHWLHACGEIIGNENVKAIEDHFHYTPEANKYLHKGMTMYRFE